MQNLEQHLGYTFRNKQLLKQALTHASVTSDIHCNYERLEFLGDRILGVTVADMLCKMFTDEPEGSLSQRFVRLVCKETVAEVSRNLGVNHYVTVANEEVRDKDNVLCDVGEAIIAAIYLDSGDLETARNYVRKHWANLINQKSQPQKDYKTLLQEKAAMLKLNAPVYLVLDKKGPEHAPIFSVKLTVGELETISEGDSKKHAEQKAAALMLDALLQKYEAKNAGN